MSKKKTLMVKREIAGLSHYQWRVVDAFGRTPRGYATLAFGDRVLVVGGEGRYERVGLRTRLALRRKRIIEVTVHHSDGCSPPCVCCPSVTYRLAAWLTKKEVKP